MRSSHRWQPHQAKAFGKQLRDLNRYPVSFVIKGNHEDPNGNAIPYERMTQASKILDPRALRYKAWKLYVLQCFTEQARQGFPCEPDGYYRLDVKCFFIGENHADGENVRKGIQDALFEYGDKHVVGSIEPIEHVTRGPRVEVRIDRPARQGEKTETSQSAVKKLLDFAGRAVLFDIAGLEAAVEAAEKRLPPPGDLAYKLALANLEMAKKVLSYTAAYSLLLKNVTRDYRCRILQADAAADPLEK